MKLEKIPEDGNPCHAHVKVNILKVAFFKISIQFFTLHRNLKEILNFIRKYKSNDPE